MRPTPHEIAAATLEKLRTEHEEEAFIIICLGKKKHPDNGTPQTMVGIATNLDGPAETAYWLSDALTNIMNDGLQRKHAKS
jgi:hypothetical protein